MTLRVLIADDHPMFRKGLSGVLSEAGDIEVVAAVSDGDGALELTGKLRPDVVLMDLHMPTLGGLEATRLLAERCESVRILVLTMRDDDESLFAAVKAGAHGYLVKGATGEQIVGAVRALASGEAVFGTDVAGRVLVSLMDRPARRDVDRPFPQLTEREQEILELVTVGRRNGEIARLLVLSEKTVRNHVSNVYVKLGVVDRSQAIALGRAAGLGAERPEHDTT